MPGRFARMVLCAVLAAGAIMTSALAQAGEDAAVPLRLIGEAPAMGAGEARHFVIDARVTKPNGDPEIKGWLAALPPETGFTFIAGTCHDGEGCGLSFFRGARQVWLRGDLLGSQAPIPGRFEISAGNDDEAHEGTVTFTPFTDAVPGLGALVTFDAVDSPALNDLLLWSAPTAVLNVDAGPIDEVDRELLAQWQGSRGRPATGLLLASDLAELTRHRREQQSALKWTVFTAPDKSWSAGYPAALLHPTAGPGAGQVFASADGKARLAIAIDPPVDEPGLNALIQRLVEDPVSMRTDMHADGTGPDQAISYVEHGKRITQIYRSRKSGLARLTFAYPDGNDTYADIAPLVSLSLSATDEVKPGP